jgi:hypothetical protein
MKCGQLNHLQFDDRGLEDEAGRIILPLKEAWAKKKAIVTCSRCGNKSKVKISFLPTEYSHTKARFKKMEKLNDAWNKKQKRMAKRRKKRYIEELKRETKRKKKKKGRKS